MEVAKKYGMIQPAASNTQAVRAVFVIDPKGIIRAILYYPLSTGRNFDEIKRPGDRPAKGGQRQRGDPSRLAAGRRRDRADGGQLRHREGAHGEQRRGYVLPRLVLVLQKREKVKKKKKYNDRPPAHLRGRHFFAGGCGRGAAGGCGADCGGLRRASAARTAAGCGGRVRRAGAARTAAGCGGRVRRGPRRAEGCFTQRSTVRELRSAAFLRGRRRRSACLSAIKVLYLQSRKKLRAATCTGGRS